MESKQELVEERTVKPRFLPSGNLSQLRPLTYDDLLVMANMLSTYREMILLLLDVFKSEDELIKFLDLFAGLSIKLPSRSRVYHVIENINIYKYYLMHIAEDDPEKVTAAHFGITRQYVNSIIERVEANLPENYKGGDAENVYRTEEENTSQEDYQENNEEVYQEDYNQKEKEEESLQAFDKRNQDDF
jgi:hypothetical protein